MLVKGRHVKGDGKKLRRTHAVVAEVLSISGFLLAAAVSSLVRRSLSIYKGHSQPLAAVGRHDAGARPMPIFVDLVSS